MKCAYRWTISRMNTQPIRISRKACRGTIIRRINMPSFANLRSQYCQKKIIFCFVSKIVHRWNSSWIHLSSKAMPTPMPLCRLQPLGHFNFFLNFGSVFTLEHFFFFLFFILTMIYFLATQAAVAALTINYPKTST